MKPTNEQILTEVKALKKGKYLRLVKIKVFDNNIIKTTEMVVRTGVHTESMKVNEGRTFGQLPWGNWVEGLEGLVIFHKGNYYLRVQASYCNNTKSYYTQNDIEISREQVVEQLGEKKIASSKSDCDIYNIKFDNIVEISQQ